MRRHPATHWRVVGSQPNPGAQLAPGALQSAGSTSHLPRLQTCPLPHEPPHRPQLLMSASVSTHIKVQRVSVPAHEGLPPPAPSHRQRQRRPCSRCRSPGCRCCRTRIADRRDLVSHTRSSRCWSDSSPPNRSSPWSRSAGSTEERPGCSSSSPSRRRPRLSCGGRTVSCRDPSRSWRSRPSRYHSCRSSATVAKGGRDADAEERESRKRGAGSSAEPARRSGVDTRVTANSRTALVVLHTGPGPPGASVSPTRMTPRRPASPAADGRESWALRVRRPHGWQRRSGLRDRCRLAGV